MEKKALLILVGKGMGAAALFSAGAGGYFLFAPSNGRKDRIISWAFEDKNRIVEGLENINAITQLTRVHEYHDSKFFYRCSRGSVTSSGTQVSSGAEICSRYIESKVDGGQPIWVFRNQDDTNWSTSITKDWDTYKFTFPKNVEENTKDYYGKCFPVNVESISNPCAKNNLPQGWTKSLIPKDRQSS